MELSKLQNLYAHAASTHRVKTTVEAAGISRTGLSSVARLSNKGWLVLKDNNIGTNTTPSTVLLALLVRDEHQVLIEVKN